MPIFLLLFIALLVCAIRLNRSRRLFQYLFFCRYPILSGLALFLVPIASLTCLKGVIGNWFTELSLTEISLVLFFVMITARALVLLLAIVFIGGPSRFDLPFMRESAEVHSHELQPRTTTILTALPLISWTIACAASPTASLLEWAGGTVLALAGFGGLILLWKSIQQWPRWLSLETAILGRIETFLPGSSKEEASRKALILQTRAILFFLLTVFIFLLVAFLGNPQVRHPEWFPIPIYPVLILLLGALALTGLSYRLDGKRIPVLPVAALWVSVMYGAFGADHEYAVRAPSEPEEGAAEFRPVAGNLRLSEKDVAAVWLAQRSPGRDVIPIVVTASGGGGTAAFWTASILEQLRCQADFGEEFSRSLLLVSGVSGGSLGLAYYLQEYGLDGPPSKEAAQVAAQRAGTSSLAAAAWGLACADFPRLILPALFLDNQHDRGWALESAWERAGLRDEETLLRWRDQVALGLRPTSIFNATLVETGQRLAIATHDLTPGENPDGASPCGWSQLYPDGDLRIATAARLSATFPYVTPVARPRWNGDGDAPVSLSECAAYHVGDGGYFDNDGLMSALEFLSRTIPVLRASGIRRVLLIRIRASEVPEMKNTQDGGGLMAAIGGPLITMLNVRTTSQVDRNRFALGLAREAWRDPRDQKILDPDFEVRVTDFILAEETSLSWHLSSAEIGRIQQEAVRKVAQEIEDLRRLYSEPSNPYLQKALK
jgi:hypothetical protein